MNSYIGIIRTSCGASFTYIYPIFWTSFSNSVSSSINVYGAYSPYHITVLPSRFCWFVPHGISMPNPGLWMRVSYKGLKLLLCIRHPLLFQLTYQRFGTVVSVPAPNKSLFECFNTLCYIRMQCIILTSITLHYRINPFAIFFTIIWNMPFCAGIIIGYLRVMFQKCLHWREHSQMHPFFQHTQNLPPYILIALLLFLPKKPPYTPIFQP